MWVVEEKEGSHTESTYVDNMKVCGRAGNVPENIDGLYQRKADLYAMWRIVRRFEIELHV